MIAEEKTITVSNMRATIVRTTSTSTEHGPAGTGRR